jgi:hypothetical protein
MTFRNRFLFIAFIIVSILGLIQQWRIHNKTIEDYDAPKILSGKKEMIDLRHIQRKCDCADWIPADRYKDSANLKEEDYLFIEPATKDLDVPASYWALADSGYVLRLHGEFYKGKAIPYNYIQKTDNKPVLASVFYYTSCEVVKPE